MGISSEEGRNASVLPVTSGSKLLELFGDALSELQEFLRTGYGQALELLCPGHQLFQLLSAKLSYCMQVLHEALSPGEPLSLLLSDELLIVLKVDHGADLKTPLHVPDVFLALAKLLQHVPQVHGLVCRMVNVHCRCCRQHQGHQLAEGVPDTQYQSLNGNMDHPHQENGKESPSQGCQKADVSVQVKFEIAVVPVLHMEDPLHAPAGDIFQQGRSDHSEDEDQYHAVPHLQGAQEDAEGSKAVDGDNGPMKEASVYGMVLLHGGIP